MKLWDLEVFWFIRHLLSEHTTRVDTNLLTNAPIRLSHVSWLFAAVTVYIFRTVSSYQGLSTLLVQVKVKSNFIAKI
jgi:hypothetical protein